MGIIFVLIVWAIALSIAATVGALVFGIASYSLTRKLWPKSKRVVLMAVLFPYLCVAYAGCWFVGYAVINYTVFHRDPGLGDSWETPLPNGYALMMIDTTDQGTVYNPKTQGRDGLVMGREDTVFGVRQLQIVGPLIFGGNDTGYFGRIGQSSTIVDAYFELDTKKKTRTEFKTLDELRQRAVQQGVSLNLREFASVFNDYRYTWFDGLAAGILFLIPTVAFLALARKVWILRRSASDAPLNEPSAL